MSIETEITRIKTNIANAYTKAEEKGATLPYDYKTLEYIKSTGKEYFNTKYFPTLNTKIVLEFKDDDVSQHENYFGADNAFRFQRYSSNVNGYTFICGGTEHKFSGFDL